MFTHTACATQLKQLNANQTTCTHIPRSPCFICLNIFTFWSVPMSLNVRVFLAVASLTNLLFSKTRACSINQFYLGKILNLDPNMCVFLTKGLQYFPPPQELLSATLDVYVQKFTCPGRCTAQRHHCGRVLIAFLTS